MKKPIAVGELLRSAFPPSVAPIKIDTAPTPGECYADRFKNALACAKGLGIQHCTIYAEDLGVAGTFHLHSDGTWVKENFWYLHTERRERNRRKALQRREPR